jgi:hypothetical protein
MDCLRNMHRLTTTLSGTCYALPTLGRLRRLQGTARTARVHL